ncbi:hypothetical protein N0V88_007765 [Collariella sp. IMI 366227]|nr:hypothetical protein N0V88_007765 [Collariella sp. IMI 366227]
MSESGSLDRPGSGGRPLSPNDLCNIGQVDHDDDNDGNFTQSGQSTSSASLSPSLYEFVLEHGRTFHKYKEGKYFLPNDEREQHRLDLQHTISKMLLKGKLGLAPVENPAHVIDLATGTGIWAIEYAEQNPLSSVLGTDLSPIQPSYLPANCRFEIDDVEDEWVYPQKFDYIHGRYMMPFIKKDWASFFASIYEHTAPGGWAEFQETVLYFQGVDDTIEGTALQKWNGLLLGGIKKMGRSATEALRMKSYLAEAGFGELGEKKFAVPMNAWAKGREQKALGAMQMINNLEGIEGITMAVFTRVLGWEPKDVEELVVAVKRDLKDRKIHAYMTILCAWGRKPEKQKAEEQKAEEQKPVETRES